MSSSRTARTVRNVRTELELSRGRPLLGYKAIKSETNDQGTGPIKNAAHTEPPERRRLIRLLDEEIQYIFARAQLPDSDPPLWSMDDLKWYLKMAKNWSVVALSELASQRPPGRLLDVGAFYCLASGAAYRMGWQSSGVDFRPIPNYSGLGDPARNAATAVCNICTDPLPFESESFDAVLFLEVLEHLPYSPAPAFREMRRVLRPGGRLYLTTPNPASLSRICALLSGANHEPSAESVLLEDDTFTYKGRTFFRSGREHRLWTARELTRYLPSWGFRVVDSYYYSTTFFNPDYASFKQRLRATINTTLRPFARRIPLLGGGGLFFLAEARGNDEPAK